MAKSDRSTKRISKASLKRSLRLYGFMRPYIWPFILGLACLVVSSSASLVVFSSLGKLIDFQGEALSQQVNKLTLLLGGVLLLQALASFFRIYTFAWVTQRTIAAIRQAVFDKLLSLPITWYQKQRSGEISSRVTADISAVQDSLTTYLAEFIRQIIIVFGTVFILMASSPKLALFMMGTLPVMAVLAVFFGKYVRRLSKKAQNEVAESTHLLEEVLQGISTVKAFTAEWIQSARYKKLTDAVIQTGMRNAVYRGLFAVFIILFLFGAIIAIVWYGSHLVAQNELSHGDLFSFFMLSGLMAGSVGGLADTYSQMQKAIGATENLLDILDAKVELDELKSSHSLPRPEGHLRFEQLSFAYPNRQEQQVLQDLTLDIPAGSTCALVGSSGAGKSTLSYLLMRFYQPGSGRILLDGKDIQDLDLGAYRSLLGYVPQDVMLFSGSIRENIAYAKPQATQEEIEYAAKMANAAQFIQDLPQGYETQVGDRGTQLSGGQRQRIAIARAVLANPSILILDEATSSLDTASEKLVQEALERLREGRTSLVIAHRLSTIRQARQIVVLQKGRVAETGTHESLLEQGGIYAGLVRLDEGSNP